jgi:Protein of unknown function (DUF3489)
MKTKTSAPLKAKRSATAQPPAKQQSKQSQLIELLKKKTGTTIEEMMVLTGWQAHTVRGIISGALKKRLGLNVVSTVSGSNGIRIYRITEVKTS